MKKSCVMFISTCIMLSFNACLKQRDEPIWLEDISNIIAPLPISTVYQNYLYRVDNDYLYIYDVSVAAQPRFVKKTAVSSGIATIFINKYLFLGTSSGLLIYDLANPEIPSYIRKYVAVASCDPIAFKGDFAFVTLSKQGQCRRGVNELHVLDMTNINAPNQIAKYSYKNPHGIAIQGNYLYLCEGDSGLRVLNISDMQDIKTVNTIENIDVIDAIAKDGILTLQGPKGVYQYNYTSDSVNIKQISFLPFQ